jgi:uncharacterized protein YbjT (DUF2867 family)
MIAVSGATGNIGSEVVRLLLEAGEKVRVLVRDPSKAAALSAKVEVVKADLMQPETLAAAFKGADKAFILVASIKDIPTAAGKIFEAAEKAGVKHVVFVSSGIIEYAKPAVIGDWHLEGERLLKSTSMQWTMLRPGNFASNSLRWAGMVKAGIIFSTNAEHPSAVVDPRDIAAVAAKALSSPGHEGKTYVITGPVAMTAVEQVAILSKAIGKPLRVQVIPEAGALANMMKGGMPEALAAGILELTRPGNNMKQVVTTTVADVTGRPARTYEEWLRDNARAFA